jgi:PhnB protein
MTEIRSHIRHGFGAVRAYVYGHLDLPDLLAHAFGAVEIERHETSPGAFHVETRIGDSVVVLETAEPPHAGKSPASIYLYLENADEAYRRAIEKGAVAVAEPADKPYHERSAGVRDRFGNIWWISTAIGPLDALEARALAPGSIAHFEVTGPDAARLAGFYGSLFGWSLHAGPFPNYHSIDPAGPGGPTGGIRQEAFAERVLYVKVDDLEASVKRAVELGGRVVIPPTLIPSVVHFALIEDPAGNRTGLVQ